ncbi:hypothetical protein BCR33DRAFT_41044 [Rhizoclosmatium globosum]|uniref:Uncharacterized protein n=1 Tax=Rhizoclosmatium globosum TaxID=329046 RepID=A0A1Y2CP87_9FUNG|nr:hypothetical protein BCR33DRAFT_41044 [Rhizoclosmatium globosum]|eukprot:ORY48654.1 hypothetical protein BCR33DRAFT_41044 [Rhizoclosmatium globosum]
MVYEMISKFSADYVSYLVSLGFETLNMENYKPKASDEWISVPSFAITKDLRIEVPPLYLVKNIKGGVFIVQIGVDGFCVAINSYMLRYPSGPLNPFDEGRRYGAENESDIQFKSDCNFFKGSLHVHSFSYDFHIRYFQHILDHQPNCVIDLLDVMKTFEKYNSSRFVYARSRMLVGECLTEAQNLSASLFQYILKNPRIYGFKSISHNGVPTACFLTSEFPDFAAKHSQFEKGPFCYTVVIYMSQDTNLGSGTSLSDSETSANSHRESKLRLRYFLLIIDRENSSPLQGLDTKNQSFVNQSYAESLKEYLSGGCYLGDIAKFAEKKIEQLVEQVLRQFHHLYCLLKFCRPFATTTVTVSGVNSSQTTIQQVRQPPETPTQTVPMNGQKCSWRKYPPIPDASYRSYPLSSICLETLDFHGRNSSLSSKLDSQKRQGLSTKTPNWDGCMFCS